jgi:hypothetical protein
MDQLEADVRMAVMMLVKVGDEVVLLSQHNSVDAVQPGDSI